MDLIGVLPLNLVLAYTGNYVWYVNAIISVLRLSRMVQVWRLPRLLGRFELVHRNISTPIQMFKVILFLFLLWHWTSCLLFWLELDVAGSFNKNWAE